MIHASVSRHVLLPYLHILYVNRHILLQCLHLLLDSQPLKSSPPSQLSTRRSAALSTTLFQILGRRRVMRRRRMLSYCFSTSFTQTIT